MGLQSTTARDAALAAKRSHFVGWHGLRDFKLSGRSLMIMARDAGADPATLAEVRERFTYSYGTSLKWDGPTWDHLEMLGRDGRLMVMVSHPYAPPSADCPDLELFRRAGLVVALGGERESWYGHRSYHVRVEHPALSGRVVRPAGPPAVAGPSPSEAPYEARLRRAAPRLLAVARAYAEQLAGAIGLCPCTHSLDGAACIRCQLWSDYARARDLIAEVDGPDGGPHL